METIICLRMLLFAIMSLTWRTGVDTGFAKAEVVVTTMNEISVREGETVTLVCTYTPKTDSFTFGLLSWQMSDTVLASISCPNGCTSVNSDPSKFRLDVDQIFSGNLTITDITLDDDNPYKCLATSFDGTGTSVTTLVVNVPPTSLLVSDTKAPDGYSSGSIILVLAGQERTMTCATEPGANPAATLTWTTDTVQQFSQGVQIDQAVADSKLTSSSRKVTFNPTIDDHMTRVSCGATHPALDTGFGSFVQLDVQVPPSEVTIKYGGAVIADGETLILQEGSRVTITCKSLGTRPASTIDWFLDGADVNQGVSSRAYAPNAADVRLEDSTSTVVLQPTRDHHGKVMRCQATVFGISRSSALILSVEGPPDPPVITGLTQDLRENQQTTISCEANNGHPAPAFQWFVGQRNLTQDATLQMSTDVNDRIDALSQLTYTPLRKDNGGALRCSMTHPTLSQPMSVMSDTLIVNYCPTSVEVTVCPEVEAGSSAVLTCRSGAANPASNLVWLRGTETIDDVAKLQTHFEESNDPVGRRTSLSYRRTFSQDDYLQSFQCCTSQSLTCVTTTCSVPCVPNVKYPPSTPVINRNIPNRYVDEGTEGVEITCRSDGNPKPSLVWIFEENPGMLQDQATLDDGSQVLRFGEVHRRNAGVYNCIANNGVGSPRESSDQLIVRFPATILNKGENRTTANEGGNASLSCIAEGFPDPIVNWERADGNVNDSISTWNRISITQSKRSSDYKTVLTSLLSIHDVRPKQDHGLYRCIASNGLGFSREEVIITLTGTSKPEPPSNVVSDVRHRKANELLVSWQPGYNGGAEQTFVVMYCLDTTPKDCESVYGIRSLEHVIFELHPFSFYTISVSANNSNGLSSESSALVVSTAPLPPSGYGIQVSKRKGVVAITSDAPEQIPADLCFMIASRGDMCDPASTCYKPDIKVQRPIDQVVTVVSFGRGLCSAAEPVQAAELAGNTGSQMPVIGAVIGSVIVLLVLFVIIILIIRRKQSEKGAKAMGSGMEGQGVDKNGQARPFLSGGYCAYNPVYDDVAKEDFRISQHEGRMVSDDGLIYAEVTHQKAHPKDKPPIRTEEETMYAALDFQQMKKNEEEEEKKEEEEEEEEEALEGTKEEEERAEKEALIYENVTPGGGPESPV